MNRYLICYLLYAVASIYGANAAALATDKANVKLIACNDAQTVSTSDKAVLFKNSFTKCAEPFGILVAGSKGMTDFTVLQTAKIMAELLDQNRDGVADDPKVVAKLKCNVWMKIHSKANSVSLTGRSNYFEVDKFFHEDGKPTLIGKKADPTRVEEVHHAITQWGYGLAYPAVFGTDGNWNSKSTLVTECKKARCDWWTHPENKCLTKKPLLLTTMGCMRTQKSYPGKLYPANDGKKCTASESKETCAYTSCDCIEWYHQVNLIYAGQKPAWITKFRKEAGLTGDQVMPTTKATMIALLKKKNKPLLDVLQNKKYNQLQKPMTFDYPVVSGTAPTLTACASNGGGTTGGDDNGDGETMTGAPPV